MSSWCSITFNNNFFVELTEYSLWRTNRPFLIVLKNPGGPKKYIKNSTDTLTFIRDVAHELVSVLERGDHGFSDDSAAVEGVGDDAFVVVDIQCLFEAMAAGGAWREVLVADFFLPALLMGQGHVSACGWRDTVAFDSVGLRKDVALVCKSF